MSASARAAPKRQARRTLSSKFAYKQYSLSQLEVFYATLNCQNQFSYSPSFFSASVSRQSWESTVVLIDDENQSPVGILYAKERRLLGMRTGLFFADATLGCLMAAHSDDQYEAYWAGVGALLRHPRMQGLRLLAPPVGHEAELLRALAEQNGLDFCTSPAESHLVLSLPPTYEEFLASLGSKTRRNFRYYRNRSETAGHVYVENIPLEEFSRAAWELEAQGPVGGNNEGLRRSLSMFGAAAKPLLVGLKSDDGELVSLIGGWHEADRVVIFMQLNSDKKHAKYSLSLVVRAHLIERLIAQHCTQIVWWAGVGEPISHYCTPVPSAWICVDSPGPVWRSLRSFINRHRDRLPARLKAISEWIVPSSRSEHTASVQICALGEPE